MARDIALLAFAAMRYIAAEVIQAAGVDLQALLATAAGLEGHVLRLVLCAWIQRDPALSIGLRGAPYPSGADGALAGRIVWRRAGQVRSGLAGG